MAVPKADQMAYATLTSICLRETAKQSKLARYTTMARAVLPGSELSLAIFSKVVAPISIPMATIRIIQHPVEDDPMYSESMAK
eukprot:CAMPEP_0195521660 /NCGR_PEP_ID=MMETSP0794_2-20130614/19130_1 /TAXON_ID=515487 /ORGANISM="Stephanopyxis turris, Strain CCMP 815" /LENGTH=82 /DNA_ID=CAMNT_0040651267 /DNA_START=114 /DNA_END=362 /DNA_ORIENTATION=+